MADMMCQKTGATIFLDEYGQYCHCDLFSDGHGWIARIVDKWRPTGGAGTPRHATVHHVGLWWDEDKTSGQQPSTLYATEVTFHGYEGALI